MIHKGFYFYTTILIQFPLYTYQLRLVDFTVF
nr:MAG TPA: hypothetical protein [Caudoviricetes sp.]